MHFSNDFSTPMCICLFIIYHENVAESGLKSVLEPVYL